LKNISVPVIEMQCHISVDCFSLFCAVRNYEGEINAPCANNYFGNRKNPYHCFPHKTCSCFCCI